MVKGTPTTRTQPTTTTTAAAAAKDLEAGSSSSPNVASKHYVPVVELFRGHWAGILVQTTYEACEYTN